MPDDSATRVEIAIRAAHLAKTVLELLSLSPELARLQLGQIAQELREMDDFLKKKGK
jgi:hypothetical protein